MATTIQLTQSSSNLIGYLNGWTSGFGSTYGAFYDAQTSSLATATIDPNTTYEAWGDGSTGGKGIVMSGALQYSQGNLTGSVDSIVLGTGYSQSTSGIAVSQQELLIDPDGSYSLAGARDLLDLAVYQLARFGSLAGFYDYFAATGTVIEDTASSNTLTGFAGADTFVFSGGHDIVAAGPTGTYGYQDGTDKLDVSGWGSTSVSDLYWVDDAGDTIVGSYSNSSVSITLVGVDSSVLDASDFIFASASALAA
jgi:hypothetical protein